MGTSHRGLGLMENPKSCAYEAISKGGKRWSKN